MVPSTNSVNTTGNCEGGTSTGYLQCWPYYTWPTTQYIYTDRGEKALRIIQRLREAGYLHINTADEFIKAMDKIMDVL